MDTVAIVGNSSATRDLAPFGNPNVEIWALTWHALRMPRVSAVFEMHEDVLTGERWGKYEGVEDYRRWLREQRDTPIWMHRVHAEIPKSAAYPKQEVIKRYRLHHGGDELKRFFGGSASYAIALAAHMGYVHIHLYGIALAHSHEEYRRERDAVFYWMGRSTALGVHIHIPEQSQLFADMEYPQE